MLKNFLIGFFAGVAGAYTFNVFENKIEDAANRRFVLRVATDDGSGVVTIQYLTALQSLSTDIEDAQVFNGIDAKNLIKQPYFASFELEELPSQALMTV